MKKNIEAYLTVEAAYVMPIVLSCILFVMYILIFQHNRCIMEQEAGTMAVRGAQFHAQSAKERLSYMKNLEGELGEDRYFMWNKGKIVLRQAKGKVTVQNRGHMNYPFAGWGFDGLDHVWGAEVTYQNSIIDPVSFLRTKRNISIVVGEE